MPLKAKGNCSEELWELLGEMLSEDPEVRPSVDEINGSKWVGKMLGRPVCVRNVNFVQSYCSGKFSSSGDLSIDEDYMYGGNLREKIDEVAVGSNKKLIMGRARPRSPSFPEMGGDMSPKRNEFLMSTSLCEEISDAKSLNILGIDNEKCLL